MSKTKIAVLITLTVSFIAVSAFFGFLFGRAWLIQHDNEMIKVGRQQMYQEHYADVATDAARRREMEKKIRDGIASGVDKATKEFQAQQAARAADDLITRDKVELLIAQSPDYYTNRLCTVPDDMLAQRNQIRLNGTGH